MLTIRPISEALLPLYHQINTRSLAAEYAVVSVSRAGLSLGYARMPAAEWVQRAPLVEIPAVYFLTHADCACFFAFEDDQCVGELSVRAGRGGVADVLDVRVEAGRRRQGIGRELLRTALLWARTHGVDRLRLETDDGNPVACQFATGCGFALRGLDTEALLPSGARPARGIAGGDPRQLCALFFYIAVDNG